MECCVAGHLQYLLHQGEEASRDVYEQVTCLAASPCGSFLAAGSMHGQATVWSLATGRVAGRRRSHTGSILATGWLSSSLLATVGMHGAVHVLEFVPDSDGNLDSQHMLRLQAHSGDVNCLSVSPDGKMLCTGGDDGTARIWQVEKVCVALQGKPR
jgi:WD40 repeat protein